MARLREQYENIIKPSLMKKFGYTNSMMVPKLEKIVLNMGISDAVKDRKVIDNAVDELSMIAGQKAVMCRAKKSIAGFKLREGMPIGVKVTLRREKMYEFLDRLVNIAMPRIRDFRGISSKSFDVSGNYAMGIKEHIIFPEIDYDKVGQVRGLDVVFVIKSDNKEESKELLSGFSMPFTK